MNTPSHGAYLKIVEELLGSIDGDNSISDTEYLDLMDEIADDVMSRAAAKREELRRAGKNA